VSLTPPTLDDRDFETLYRQARARIPNYLPEWTDLNESDPGVALLQLQTWLAETILYRLNRLPELNYYKFLKLIGVEQRPATAATAQVTFVLDEKKLPGASEIIVPPATLLRVSSRDLPEPVFFETDESLTAIVARLERLVAFEDPAAVNPIAKDVSLDNTLDNRSFKPFGDAPVKDKSTLLLGFASEAPMTRREFTLHVFLKDEPLGPLDDTPRADDCGPKDATGTLLWQWWDGRDWDKLEVRDETADLRRSGPIYVRIPGQIPAMPADVVTGQPMSPPIGIKDLQPDVDEDTWIEIVDEFENGDPPLKTVADVAKQQLNTLCERLESVSPGIDDETKKKLVKEIIARAQYLSTTPLFYWLQVVYTGVEYKPAPPEIERIVTNTVGVTQAQTVADEVVGGSDGMPNQIMRLRHAPILQPEKKDAPALVLEIDEEGEEPQKWRQVDDFAGSKLGGAKNNGSKINGSHNNEVKIDKEALHYVLNRTTGEIRFGDNRYGKIPRAGQGNVVARKYRYGGGRAGNVGARTIKELVRPILGVEEVFNLTGAQGGEDEEPLAETLQRVPREMRANRRAVTLDDFALLARETPGAQVVRSYAYIKRDFVEDPGPEHCGTRVHVVVVPRSYDPRPSPNETTIRMVCKYLDERRLVTTQVIVEGPTYEDVAVVLRVKAQPTVDRGAAERAIKAAVQTYLHPFDGGPDRLGWPFGRDIFYSELLREVMAVPGVLRVDTLNLLRLAEAYGKEVGGGGEKGAKDHPLPKNDACLTLTTWNVKNLLPGADPLKPWAALETYNCCDLPVAEGALISLFHIDLQVDYDRNNS